MLRGRQLAEGSRAGAPTCCSELRGLPTRVRAQNTRRCPGEPPSTSSPLFGQPRQTRWQCHCCCELTGASTGASAGASADAGVDAESLQEAGPFTAADRAFMAAALEQAYAGAAADEVPIGAVLVVGDRIIAAAHNRTHALRSPLAHAEMLCLAKGSSRLRAWRLLDATLYVTLEPCPMCAGALLQARVARVVYGARQPRVGADGSWVQLFPRQEPASETAAAASGGARGTASMGTGGGAGEAEISDAANTGSSGGRSGSSCGCGASSRARDGGQSVALEGEQDPGLGEPPPGHTGHAAPGAPPSRPHPFHNSVVVQGGCRAEECADVVRAFFRRRRQQRQAAAAAAVGPESGTGLGTGTLSEFEEFG